MIVVLKPNTRHEDAQEILGRIEKAGLKPLYMPGTERVVLGAIGDERVLRQLRIENDPNVESVKPILAPYKLASRELHPHDTIVHLGNVPVGGMRFIVIAGPCAVESEDQMLETAEIVKSNGGHALRGGAFKPRTSPYSFQGLGLAGLKILRQVSEQVQLPVVTEVVEVGDIDAVAEYADAFQVGARNMQNFRLLAELGKQDKAVVLKRGMAAKIDDLLLAAEYILEQGNPNVILCERGIKTFETATRNTLDLSAIPFIKKHSHLPIIVDPSHGVGVRDMIAPMTLAAVACGADGVIVETHRNPKEALSDAAQALYPEQFEALMAEIVPFVKAAGRTL